MNITHHKNGEIKTLVDEAPYHPGYEDAGFKPKEINNEPVAWMRTNKQWRKEVSWVKKEGFDIPLYTHPAKTPMLVLDGNRVYPTAKTLTDEEIKEIAKESGFVLYKNGIDWSSDYDKELYKFARAILKKASEK